ncbi:MULTISPECIES: glycosyltransferase family 4 protein [unclassified Flavobacterium]|uniref:glycosyltransferase family 4 protein n=1 Tax=unclassified Flavobacterium TaxID=196869 RepID=UPI0012AAB5AC|nr:MULTISPECIES: glycosyltransferase family 4 protein [unclassified Flavobacterium]MBF4486004.1 glycosyltransferase family 4 protein [Flavobacterium sp. CSZ]QGK76861.1 glycosyltransferase [Flavobacterium sp. SLB02]
MNKIIRLSTVPISLNVLLKGQLEFLNKHYNVIAVSGKGIDLNQVVSREGVEVFSVEMERKISPVKDFVSLVKLYFYFKKERPLIVHSITPKAGLLSMTAAKFAGVPIRIHTFTGLIFPSKQGLFQKILILMDKLLCLWATNIYPEGEGVKNDLINYKITKKPLKVIGNGNVNGIDTNYFNPGLFNLQDIIQERNKLGISENDFVFVFVGRLVKDKGINELINAFSKFQYNYKNVKLLLVGPFEDDLDPLNTETIKTIKESENIISVGFQNDVRAYYAMADTLVFPSYREGFPNVVMQAGAMGLPSIVTNINGCNEIIIEHENGIIIPVKDSASIYDAMEKMLTDKEYCYKLGTNARISIISRYEQQLVWNAILSEYKSLEKNV